MRKKYVAPRARSVQLLCEGFLAESLPLHTGSGSGGSGGTVKDDSDWAARRKRRDGYDSALWRE